MNPVTTVAPCTAENSLGTPSAAAPTSASKPRVWTSFATLAAAMFLGNLAIVIAFVIGGVVIGVKLGASGVNPATISQQAQQTLSQPLVALLLSVLPFQLTMTCVVLFAARRSREPLRERLGLVPQTGRSYAKCKLATLACFSIAAAFGFNIVSFILAGHATPPDSISAALDGTWGTTLGLSVIPALVEETLFRGYIQRRFLKRWSPAVAISASTLLFAGMHMDSWQHVIAVIPLGAVLGLLAWRTNSTKPGMLVHGLHNVVAVGFAGTSPVLAQLVGGDTLGGIVLGAIPVLGLIGLPMVISLLRCTKSNPQAPTAVTMKPPVESLSMLKQTLAVAEHVSDSRLASQAL